MDRKMTKKMTQKMKKNCYSCKVYSRFEGLTAMYSRSFGLDQGQTDQFTLKKMQTLL